MTATRPSSIRLKRSNRYATKVDSEPNVTFFMDLGSEIGRSRIGKDVDRLDGKDGFHYRVYKGTKR